MSPVYASTAERQDTGNECSRGMVRRGDGAGRGSGSLTVRRNVALGGQAGRPCILFAMDRSLRTPRLFPSVTVGAGRMECAGRSGGGSR